MPTLPERVAALEAERPYIKEKLTTIDGNVKVLVDAHNKQKGMARLGTLILNAGIGAAGVWAGFAAAMRMK